MLTSAEGFGLRLRSARIAKNISGQWMVDYINGYMIPQDYPPLSLNTYYSWEKIGTPNENKRGRRWPHVMELKIILIPLGVTGYWLFNGDMDGRIVRDRADLPELKNINYGLEQTIAIQAAEPLMTEIHRVKGMLSPDLKRDLTRLLSRIR